MKTISRVGVWGCCWVAGLAVSAQGAEFILKPIRASGTYTIVGNEIRLTGAGQRVFLEVQLKGWTPNLLRTYEAKIDASTYDGASDGMATGTLAPASQACSGNNSTGHAQCVAAFAVGARCTVPDGAGFKCEPGFIDRFRTNWVFFDMDFIVAAVDLSTPNYRYVSILNTGAATDS